MPRLLLRLLPWMIFGWLFAPLADAEPLVVVLSQSSAGYVQVRDAVLTELENAGVPKADVRVLLATELEAIEGAAAQHPHMWLTLGADALTSVLPRASKVPVLAALIPRLGFERILAESASKGPQIASALYLDQPFSRQLDLLHLALPGIRRVGVLWGPESIVMQRSVTAAMQGHGFEPVYGTVRSEAALFPGLKQALDDADVLLAVADPLVYNSTTVSNILLATYRARIPVVAFSPAYVKAGALLALYSTPKQIGVQAAQMARTMLQGGSAPPSQYPSDYVVGVNDYVARSLGLALDGESLAERLHRSEKRP